ncbi:hypothetical protein ASPWEDRAFT_40317 [Aspergillus wentii DTO 134E9]|uniref:Uncharacterized protein n=1 Tax=Aspergillus wentii DTO 134E9 TaxID=1073089 RepID=A0A1L9RJR2_ASPWE|nr:uncharacterized protein ASPWEDRAFT_40317 [Aspergillus wentii DTO 134E9]OJJ35143.1 hypothetical protein ASPWEDRAFT_40317 [Aspergillus wentii DTO 134E9]
MAERIITCYFHMRIGSHGDATCILIGYICRGFQRSHHQEDTLYHWTRMIRWSTQRVPSKALDRRKTHYTSEYHPD